MRAAGESGSPPGASPSGGEPSPPPGGEELPRRLDARRAEIERAILARVQSLSGPGETRDPEYLAGLREAVASAVAYGLSVAGAPERESPPIPASLFAQARRAARSGVGLDTVLRRYCAGFALLGDFLLAAGGDAHLQATELQKVWRALAALFEGLLAAIAQEHTEEASAKGKSREQRRSERVRKLLAGELLDSADLGYELDAHHLGAIAAGPGARRALRELASTLDRRLLLVEGGGGSLWAWLGSKRALEATEALRVASTAFSPEVSLALGETGEGISGWRLTHRQAKAAAPIALRKGPSLVRYADVALLASALADEVLAESLRKAYLAPLEEERDGGVSLRETLRAYFAAGRNASSAAAALGTSRQTVNKRLALTQERIGRPLDSCAAELETALRLEELEVPQGSK